MGSGLYAAAAEAGMLIPHEEVAADSLASNGAYKVIKPVLVNFISYPYEWCFSQLKDAALVTLALQRKALTHGMSLKDASAYNIQYVEGKPLCIDTLSFEKYREGLPWIAYRQFCQHFLAPLALMSRKDIRLHQLLRIYIDGIPLDLAASILPFRMRFRLGVLLHLYMHSRSQKHYAHKAISKETLKRQVSRKALLGLVESLDATVRSLTWQPVHTQWADYYDRDSYSVEAIEHKKRLVSEYLDQSKPEKVWDLGANAGLFSRIASGLGAYTVSIDSDPGAVEVNYLENKRKGEGNVLPLLCDLTNPSPAQGWASHERQSLYERGPVECLLVLALVHHLSITNNVPLEKVAILFRQLCRHLIIEFVPKEDPKVKRMLMMREDVFGEYTQERFEAAFSSHFSILRRDAIRQSNRILYLMMRN